jgi:hypothetical protein
MGRCCTATRRGGTSEATHGTRRWTTQRSKQPLSMGTLSANGCRFQTTRAIRTSSRSPPRAAARPPSASAFAPNPPSQDDLPDEIAERPGPFLTGEWRVRFPKLL